MFACFVFYGVDYWQAQNMQVSCVQQGMGKRVGVIYGGPLNVQLLQIH